ncbi:MAG: hypothetical protein ACLR4Z_19040 [Butyricicoccaceae bacterium]
MAALHWRDDFDLLWNTSQRDYRGGCLRWLIRRRDCCSSSRCCALRRPDECVRLRSETKTASRVPRLRRCRRELLSPLWSFEGAYRWQRRREITWDEEGGCRIVTGDFRVPERSSRGLAVGAFGDRLRASLPRNRLDN